uniref:Homeobox domain-containing protein n=1 Tax=Haemonchus contortus TaxID=6289 RepID=A0A7I5EDX6_HAECO
MEDPIGRLLHVLATDTRSEQYSHYGIGNSKYKQALMEVFLERKETIRTRLDPTVYDFKARRLLVRANSMLRALEDPVLSESAAGAQAAGKLDVVYRRRLLELRNLLHSHLYYLQQGCQHIILEFHRVMRNQQVLRPIDEQDIMLAFGSIRYKHELMESETSEVIAGSLMMVQRRMADARKRRHNFDREVIGILQEYYDDHSDHPYPNEDEKHLLAARCHISVQQVSNWFGNRRIRSKKSQRSQNFTELF